MVGTKGLHFGTEAFRLGDRGRQVIGRAGHPSPDRVQGIQPIQVSLGCLDCLWSHGRRQRCRGTAARCLGVSRIN